MTVMISLDIGTSKMCSLALDCERLEPIAVRCKPNDADVFGLPAGCHEQDPLRILDCALSLVQELVADETVASHEIRGLSVTGQMHGVLLANRDLQPVTNLITWRDQRIMSPEEGSITEEARRRVGALAFARTGCRLHAGYGGMTLFRLARGGHIVGDCTALTIADYVTATLSGVVATEATHAASWGLLNLRSGDWDREVVEELGLPPRILPEIRPTSRPLKAMRASYARSLGFPSDAQVCAPIGDNQASILGVAGIATDAAVVNLGTGAQVSIPQSEVVSVEGFETRPMPFGGQILVAATICGGWSYAYLRRFFQDVVREFADVELEDRQVYERMNRLAAEATATSDGLSVDTRFAGTRELPHLCGSVRHIDAQNLTAGNLSRAFLVGMVRELADMFHRAECAGVTRIIASGNAARENPLLLNIIESLFQRTCQTSIYPEEAALGAAYAAMIGMGLYSPSFVRPDDAAPPRLGPHFAHLSPHAQKL